MDIPYNQERKHGYAFKSREKTWVYLIIKRENMGIPLNQERKHGYTFKSREKTWVYL